ncbi:MAG: aldo/keto reductase [Xanthomonadales bacterium]|nr:aldo/keto reductase [Xanthomonadales bacterium]
MTPILGTMRWGRWGAALEPAAIADLLLAALDHGLDTLDLADIYGDGETTARVGAALKRVPGLRQRLKLVFKTGIVLGDATGHGYRYDHSPAAVSAALAQAQQDLGTEHLDLLMLHRHDPLSEADTLAPLVEGWIADGRIGGFGVSNFDATSLAAWRAVLPIQAHQFQLGLGALDALAVHTASRAAGASCQAWSPLAEGRLLDPGDPRGARLLPLLHQIGPSLRMDPAQLALAWVHTLPGTRAIIGTHRIARIAAAAHAAQGLPAADWYALLAAARGERLP